MMYLNSRGGAKPSMLRGEITSLPVHTSTGVRKEGLYQVGKENKKRVLARLVELPSWLSDKAKELKSERKPLLGYLTSEKVAQFSNPVGSKGHILINSKGVGVDTSEPLVGLDKEIFDKLENLDVEAITFHVHCEDYQRIERWEIEFSTFLTECIDVNPGGTFSQQMMVPLSLLSRYANC